MSACLLYGSPVENKNMPPSINMEKVGGNTGNLLFQYSLSKLLKVDLWPTTELIRSNSRQIYDTYITTDIIWISENPESAAGVYKNVMSQLSLCGDRPLVPISIGLQCGYFKNDFHILPELVHLMSEMQERAVLGVRGEYTAEILSNHGIRNVEVIGCPSLYLPFDNTFSINRKAVAPKRVNVNLRTMYKSLTMKEIKFLVYSANRKYTFCEQTLHPFSRSVCRDEATYEYVCKWLYNNKLIFFSVDDWRSYISEMDFSMGSRFHGNVIALWEKVPALFIPMDSRVEELCRFFCLPTMKMEDFDYDKHILNYYEMADYTEFNRVYSARLENFIDFLKVNNIPIRERLDTYYDSKLLKLQKKLELITNSCLKSEGNAEV